MYCLKLITFSGLISAHILASDYKGLHLKYTDSFLLRMAVDLADRLLAAFKTPTGIRSL
jgi:hypothetical protein